MKTDSYVSLKFEIELDIYGFTKKLEDKDAQDQLCAKLKKLIEHHVLNIKLQSDLDCDVEVICTSYTHDYYDRNDHA